MRTISIPVPTEALEDITRFALVCDGKVYATGYTADSLNAYRLCGSFSSQAKIVSLETGFENCEQD